MFCVVLLRYGVLASGSDGKATFFSSLCTYFLIVFSSIIAHFMFV